MAFAHVTDLHLAAENEYPDGADVRANFLKVLDAVRAEDLTHVVLGGDLAWREPDEALYGWVRKNLTDRGLSWDAIPGNHDDPVLLARGLDLTAEGDGERLWYQKDCDGRTCLFLDSWPAVLGGEQEDWIRDRLDRLPSPVPVFLHHPPYPAGVPHMDRHWPYVDPEGFRRLAAEAGKTIWLFCGHYHVERVQVVDGVTIFITPSLIFQFDDTVESFLIGTRDIAWRRIEWDNGVLTTSVRWLPGVAGRA